MIIVATEKQPLKKFYCITYNFLIHTRNKECVDMKKMMIASGIGMACGAGMVAYLITNKNTKKNADKLLNTMMDEANHMIKDKN